MLDPQSTQVFIAIHRERLAREVGMSPSILRHMSLPGQTQRQPLRARVSNRWHTLRHRIRRLIHHLIHHKKTGVSHATTNTASTRHHSG